MKRPAADRPKRPFRMDYPTNPGPRGSAKAWRNAFHARLGLDAARATVGDESPEAILGVDRGATWEQIRTAYRRAARANHPDFGGDAAAFRRIQAAYEVLEARHGR